MSLLYSEKIPAQIRDAFAQKLESVASHLGVHPDWLMQVMKAESALSPTAQNWQGTGSSRHLVAVGLLQFTKASGIIAKGIVKSLEQILAMDALQQLDLVKWYFTPYRGKMKSYYDVYAVTFFPAMIGKPDNWVLQTKKLSAATIAKQNKGIAKGKAHITVADFKHYTENLVPKELRDRLFNAVHTVADVVETKVDQVKSTISSHPESSLSTGLIVVLAFLGWFVFRKG